MDHSLTFKAQLNVHHSIATDLKHYASMANILSPTKKAKVQATLFTFALSILHSK